MGPTHIPISGHIVSRKEISTADFCGIWSISEPFWLWRGGTSCFLPENPRLHVLPVRVVLGSKLPPSLVSVGEAARLRRQRHSQKQAQGRVAGNHQFRDDLEVMARLLLGPKAHPG